MDRQRTQVCLCFPCGSEGQESAAMQETWVQSLGLEDPLKEGMVNHSTILARRILMDREDWGATGHGKAKSLT